MGTPPALRVRRKMGASPGIIAARTPWTSRGCAALQGVLRCVPWPGCPRRSAVAPPRSSTPGSSRRPPASRCSPGPVFAAPFHLPGDVDSAPVRLRPLRQPDLHALRDGARRARGRGTATVFSSGMAAVGRGARGAHPAGRRRRRARRTATARCACSPPSTSARAASRSGSCRRTRSSWRRRRRARGSSGPRCRRTRRSTSSTSRRSRARPAAPGALLAVDSTLATPLAQRPLELGADLVGLQRLEGHDRPRRPHHGPRRRRGRGSRRGRPALAHARRRRARPAGDVARAPVARDARRAAAPRVGQRARARRAARGAARRDGRALPRAARPPGARARRAPDERDLRPGGVLRAREARRPRGGSSTPPSSSRRRRASAASTRWPSGARAGAWTTCRRASSGSARGSRTPPTCSPTSRARWTGRVETTPRRSIAARAQHAQRDGRRQNRSRAVDEAGHPHERSRECGVVCGGGLKPGHVRAGDHVASVSGVRRPRAPSGRRRWSSPRARRSCARARG